jgi:hypothetical protein
MSNLSEEKIMLCNLLQIPSPEDLLDIGVEEEFYKLFRNMLLSAVISDNKCVIHFGSYSYYFLPEDSQQSLLFASLFLSDINFAAQLIKWVLGLDIDCQDYDALAKALNEIDFDEEGWSEVYPDITSTYTPDQSIQFLINLINNRESIVYRTLNKNVRNLHKTICIKIYRGIMAGSVEEISVYTFNSDWSVVLAWNEDFTYFPAILGFISNEDVDKYLVELFITVNAGGLSWITGSEILKNTISDPIYKDIILLLSNEESYEVGYKFSCCSYELLRTIHFQEGGLAKNALIATVKSILEDIHKFSKYGLGFQQLDEMDITIGNVINGWSNHVEIIKNNNLMND